MAFFSTTPSENTLPTLLHNQLSLVSKNRIYVKSFFEPWDTMRTGTVTKPQFARALATIGFALRPSDVELLTKAYECPRDPLRCDYRRYMHDLQAEKEEKRDEPLLTQSELRPLVPIKQQKPFFSSSSSLSPDQLSLSAIINKVQTECLQLRKHIGDLFADFDPLRRYRISPDRFHRCLDAGGFHLTQEEIEALIEAYRTGDRPPLVDYRSFVQAVEAGFVPLGVDRAPTADFQPFIPLESYEHSMKKAMTAPSSPASSTSSSSSSSSFSPSSSSSSSSPSSDPLYPIVSELIEQLAYLSYTRRILIKPSYAHFDRTHAGLITDRQFESVTGSLFPLRLSHAQYAALCDFYRKKGTELVNYAMFVDDVREAEKEYEKLSLERTSAIGGRVGGPLVEGEKSLWVPSHVTIAPYEKEKEMPFPLLLERVKEEMEQKRLSPEALKEIFGDFDKLRKGHLSKSRFHRCLLIGGLRKVTALNVDTLANQYRSEKEEGHVDYPRFIDDLDPVPKF